MNHTDREAEAKPLTLISIVGFVDSEGDLHLHPPFPVPSDVGFNGRPVESQETGGSDVILTEYAADGEVLYRYPLRPSTLCSYPGGSGVVKAQQISVFTEVVPLADECTLLHIAAGSGHHIELKRRADEPVIHFEGGTPEVRDGSVNVKWSVEPGSASVVAMCIDEAGRRPLGLFAGAGALKVDLAYIEGPNAIIDLTVSSDLRFASLKSEPFATGNASARPHIVVPSDGSEVQQSKIDFVASVPSRFRGEALEWFSSTDGVVGTGQYLRAGLSPGPHEVILRGRSGGQDEPVAFSAIRLVVSGETSDDHSRPDTSSDR